MITHSASSQRTGDCVIVALANGLEKSYSQVLDELTARIGKSPFSHDKKGGIQNYLWIPYLESFGWKPLGKIPRRGQDKLSGIALMLSNSRRRAHLVYMECGIVFDLLASKGMPIRDYQRLCRVSHITKFWIAPAAQIQEMPVNENWLDDFLSTLD